MNPSPTFPGRTATVLFGTSDSDVILASVRQLASAYDDLDSVVRSVPIEYLVRIATGSIAPVLKPTAQHRRSMNYNALASEAWAANYGWRSEYGETAPAAVFLWVSCMCNCPEPDWGFMASVRGLSVTTLLDSCEEPFVSTLQEMCRCFMAESSWDIAMSILPLYAAIELVTGQSGQVVAGVRHKLDVTPPRNEYVFAYWDPDDCESELSRIEEDVKSPSEAIHSEALTRMRACVSDAIRMVVPEYGTAEWIKSHSPKALSFRHCFRAVIDCLFGRE